MKLSPEERGYLAGFIDGEGALLINKRLHTSGDVSYIGYSVYLDLGNTNEEVLNYINTLVGNTAQIYKNPQKGNRKTAYRIRIAGRRSQELISLIKDLLIVKKKQAEIFLQFPLQHSKLKQTLKERLFQEMKALNHRGILKV